MSAASIDPRLREIGYPNLDVTALPNLNIDEVTTAPDLTVP
jgi:hypothetical protein